MKVALAFGFGTTMSLALGGTAMAAQAELPVPCVAGSCGSQTWVSAGQASAAITGNHLEVQQATSSAILNWSSFNIGEGGSVNFRQPTTDSIALNRIFQNDPSRIFGTLTANGQVYLVNHNGILFGPDSRVNTQALVASSLELADDALETGIFAPLRDGRPAFSAAQRLDAQGRPVPAGAIIVSEGARLATARGGRIMLLAPDVENAGSISTPDGQAILAAGQRVWVSDSSDENLRGLLVEVDAGGMAQNLGDITVGRGNASLIGLAVNQSGRISATTSVNLGGSIRLVARDTVRVQGTGTLTLERAGDVTFGAGSVTEVRPDLADAATAVDEQEQPLSSIEAFGRTIEVETGARLTARGGEIDLVASVNPALPLSGETAGNGARIDIAAGAVLDASGTDDVVLPMSRNQLVVELRGNELRDAPLQRDGVLYGRKVKVDVRKGTAVADISGALANIQRGVGERTTAGGRINLRSEDGAHVHEGATLDVSGGSLRYEAGMLETTRLLSRGEVIDIADARPDVPYDAVLGDLTQRSSKWGITTDHALEGSQSLGTFEAGYVEGRDAGTITLFGNSVTLAGSLVGETTQGTWQRQLPQDVVSAWARPYDQLAQGGQLVLGDASQLSAAAGTINFRLPSVTFGVPAAAPAGTLALDATRLAGDGISRLAVYSDGTISVPEETDIYLAAGGSLQLVSGTAPAATGSGAQEASLRLDGRIVVPAGEVVLRTVQTDIVSGEAQQDQRHQLALGAAASIDVSGQWINDALAAESARPTGAIALHAGSVELASAGAIDLAAGSHMQLNGGAWRGTDGSLRAGNGGDLSIASSLVVPPTLNLDFTAESYSLVQGGQLSVTTPGVRIANGGDGSVLDGTWQLDPQFFLQGGFGSHALGASHSGITIAAGTRIRPRMTNWRLTEGATRAPSGTPMSTVATREVLPDWERAPASLSLASRRSTGGGGDPDAGIVVEAGASIDADVGARVALTSDRAIEVAGTIRAPAGEIVLALGGNTPTDPTLLPDKAIVLGEGSVLDVTGTAVLRPDPDGRRLGEVRDGGSIRLRAERGAIITAPTSVIDVSGVAAALDVQDPDTGTYAPLAVAGRAGAIDLQAAEGMLISGTLRAQAAPAAGATGGSLAVRLTSAGLSPDQRVGELGLPTGAREVHFSTLTPDSLFAAGFSGGSLFSPGELQALRGPTNSVTSTADLSLQRVAQAGFDSIDVQVRPVTSVNGTALGEARVRFDAASTLAATRRISLDAPVIQGSGDTQINAAHVALGPTDTALRYTPMATGGPGTLAVQARLVDVRGDLALQGFGNAIDPSLDLTATGDLRLTGVRVPAAESTATTGSLRVAGDMHLDVAQAYPTTLSDFLLEAGGDIRVTGDADAPAPLAAGGSLHLRADNIEVSGTLRAPFGSLHLEATENLTLMDGAVVSVAGPALPVPFGQTQFGRDWVLPYEPGLLQVLGGPAEEVWSRPLPEKQVALTGNSVSLQEGAQVVLDGGGDLLAYEFVPGPGGSRDVLLPEHAAGGFALIPALSLDAAPISPLVDAAGIATGDTIQIAADVGDLPAGEYVVLPARYALLPGAFLLTPADLPPSIQRTSLSSTSDGLPIVAGRRSVSATGAADSLWGSFVVETGAQVRRRAEYRESLASGFFADAAAALPADAGQLVIDAGARLDLGGRVSAARGAAHARGGQVDIVADHIAIVATAGNRQDVVELEAGGLAQLGVESLLVGGRRETRADGTHLIVDADRVTVESGVELRMPEIILAARAGGNPTSADADVVVESGATLAGVGAGASQPGGLYADQDAALLRVSSGTAPAIERRGEASEARLMVAHGSQLAAGREAATGLSGGTIALDSSGDAASGAALMLGTGGSLQLGASRISLGDVPASATQRGLALSGTAIEGLDASNLLLRSRSSIDVHGTVDLSVDTQLVLDTPVLRGVDGAARFAAGELQWRSSSGRTPSDTGPAAGTGALVLVADVLQLGGDQAAALSSQGFTGTRLEATAALVLRREGNLITDTDLAIASPQVTATDGADWTLDAGGGFATIATAPGTAVPAPAAGLGASMHVRAREIAIDSALLLPSGNVSLEATAGNVTLGDAAAIDVAEREETFLDQQRATGGGRVSLTSRTGDVRVEEAARIDVSGEGGILEVTAAGSAGLEGELVADAGGSEDGSFRLTARDVDSFGELNRTLNDGGFGALRDIHLRTGDVSIGSGETVRARDVAITADAGGIALAGRIDASGGEAGRVRLTARDDVTVATGATIDAHATGNDQRGGTIELGSSRGRTNVAAGAVLDVRGTRRTVYERELLDANGQPVPLLGSDGQPVFDVFGQPVYQLEEVVVDDTGTVRYRMDREVLAGPSLPVLQGEVRGAGRIELEGYRAYQPAGGVIAPADVLADASNPLYADAAGFIAGSGALLGALGLATDARVTVVPGIEISSAGDLTLAGEWDLPAWRFGPDGVPGALSLRAAGNVNLQQSLSDGAVRGFDPVFGTEKDFLRRDASWSYRIAAGADLGSADVLRTRAGQGDVTVGPGVKVRTGTGDIRIAAGRDLILADEASTIYTTGVDAGNGSLNSLLMGLYLDVVYPVLGGDLQIAVGRDIQAAPGQQLVNDWLWRIGGEVESDIGLLPRSWGVNLLSFRQGVGALGGGNVDIRAGANVRNLSAVVPTTARQVGVNSFNPDSGRFSYQSDILSVAGGNRLQVTAGGDIVGGVFHLGQGEGALRSGGSITRQSPAGLFPMLGLGAGSWNVSASRDAAIETVFNPTQVTPALQQGFQPTVATAFSTYGEDSGLVLRSLAGEVRLNADSGAILNHPFLSGRGATGLETSFTMLPASLEAVSFRDDVVVNRSVSLAASPAGQLALFADGNLRGERNASPTLTMLDAIDGPSLHVGDAEPVRLVARRGDVGGDVIGFDLPKAVRVAAGRDIRNLRLQVRHTAPGSHSVLSAGRDIVHDSTRAANGALGNSASSLFYRFGGAGNVDLLAGGTIDLGTAGGIVTTGNTFDPLLADGGASVTVVSGLREPPRYDAFTEKYLATGTDHAGALAQYMEGRPMDPQLSPVENFRALPIEQQRPFIWQVFFAELRASGVDATTTGSADYSRGYAAIDALFPEAVYKTPRAGGDLNLLLSQITTLDGGDINILVPGGNANAGVATTSQLIKGPSELGVVVQRAGNVNAFVRDDFLVNQSRVFTLDGGDLLMWSSYGDIDAGRGAKSAIAAPPPLVTTDPQTGNTIVVFPPAISGSGIRAVVTTEGVKPGNVYLFAPDGVVSAGDAGIGSAGNLVIGAVEVIGADNIDVGGVAVGVPVDTGGLGASLAGVSATAAAGANAAEQEPQEGAGSEPATAASATALAWLEVFVTGVGEGNCQPDDEECLARERERESESPQ